ncbi:MAG TPA: radical SAM family heme chaperone HemW [Candidatus Angelobacter sp.]|jgi:oxygen-independent coproporphyrinogen-3 oxidase|nr:radical SAM family heme chaperone HemW [Candidatus Angelobacter sp.]
MSLGIYISVPFCRSKCSYCNFASGVFSAAQMGRYVDRLCADVAACRPLAAQLGCSNPGPVDSIYLGGGTPSLLPEAELKKLFSAIAGEFDLAPMAEITVECAPATLTEPVLNALVACGVNRVSLGVQSFVDREATSVARLHNRENVLSDIERLRRWGISNINVDLIAGLPYQTRESWNYSLNEAAESSLDISHLSIYMLEIDDDSRLGRELIAGGTRYHAHFVPNEDDTAEFYERACAHLAASGIDQYEISNFSRPGFESRHNLKYWTRQPYLGFGVDAHSMLPASARLVEKGIMSVRLSTTDSFEDFFNGADVKNQEITIDQALEESFFLGLRLNRGIQMPELARRFGSRLQKYDPVIAESVNDGLLTRSGDSLRLTPQGRLLSNEVFEKFIDAPELLSKP